ncbi:MAG: hypothetical protein JWO52_2891 [Gammaproteobacteria bacterium]|nr:hypothetical protein [Gammaproteobacteria bacterium]
MSTFKPDRRVFLGGAAFATAAGFFARVLAGQPARAAARAPNAAANADPASGVPAAAGLPPDAELAAFRTPHKYNKLVFAKSGVAGTFDERSVDCPFVFSANGRSYMTYIGYDGTGYQTGLAESRDLVNWKRAGLIMARDPNDPITRYNMALMSILRDDALGSAATLKKVHGRYLGAWHAYPSQGYEAGPAVIGLAWSEDLRHWKRTDPILRPEDGADWERGGLYKPYLLKSGDTYYLFYNAKNNVERGWIEQTGVATSKDLKTWTRYPGNPILPAGTAAGAPDTRFASDPVVVRQGKWWAMYYYGLATDGRARDLLALGMDPFHFTKVPEILVDVGPPGSIDEDYAHKPAVITHRGDLYHFYCAVGGKWPNDVRGISVARSRPWA